VKRLGMKVIYALKTREEMFWRIFNAQMLNRRIQTFHVWLLSFCRCAAPDQAS
jgi:hypothetical protein